MQEFEAVEQQIREIVATHYPDVFIVELSLTKGPSRVLSILVDTDAGITIDTCARLSRKVSAWLEENDPFDFPYNLEVSSPGIGRAFKVRRQYPQNIGRKLKVKTTEGKVVVGKLLAVDDEGILLETAPKKKPKKTENSENTDTRLAFDAIQEAKVEISFD
ncbi:MAG: ribosome assembly cofactor RimP [Bacteroidia bacterium]